MPTRTQHALQARHNERVTQTLSQAGYARDWEVTALFYSAVHLLEAKAAPDRHSRDHNERESFVLANFPAIYSDYKALFTMSLLVRYRCMRIDLPKLTQVQRWYATIKDTLSA